MNTLSLDPGERIVLEVRKHWFVFVSYGVFIGVAALAPFILYEFIYNFFLDLWPFSQNISAIFWLVYSAWLMVLWILFFVQWTNYYLDVWYITDKRIIDVEQKAMFQREVSSLRFDKIQDISIEVNGFLAHLLHYGNVKVQTAAEDSSEFSIKCAAYPERIRVVVFTQHNKEAERVAPVKIVHK